jgi:cytochrome c553
MQGPMRRMALITICFSLLAFLACGQGPESKTEPETPAESVSEHMSEHFTHVKDIQEAVIAGNLDGLMEPAKWMTEHEVAEGLPKGWEPYVAEMKKAAQAVGEASDLAQAAAATASMAETCGACHEAMNVTPQFSAGSPVPDDTGTVPHMIGHMWAADRMWEGLIIPSNEDWMNGVEVLVGAPLHSEGLSDDASMKEELESLAKRVHELAAEGRDTEGLDARAKLYGRFLATCAECHQKLGKGPQ